MATAAVMDPHEGRLIRGGPPPSEVNDGACPDQPDHIRHLKPGTDVVSAAHQAAAEFGGGNNLRVLQHLYYSHALVFGISR